ncbi:MAG TPA: 50S ribosomal protein L23 [Aggregatilineales bacterium]|jgi:large subunit ribosomal protein L23|nr:50S ribosomal protein L23 [Aggregatilineales bacterium]
MTALHLYDVIVRPVITEKSNVMSSDNNQYVFEVASNANKVQIREAVTVMFDVDVKSVNTMVMPAKRGKRGRKWYKRSQQWKKAIVTLEEGQTIGIFNV